jgi:hypothetical protein
LQTKVEEEKLASRRTIWKAATADELPDFPKLTVEDLRTLTLGTYQLKMASLYTNQHLSPDSRYNLHIHKEDEGLIRVKLQSRFSRSTKHNLWIQFTPDGAGPESISGWYCSCKAGARTMGCCAHITSAVWFLGFARHNPDAVPKRRNLTAGILNATEQLAEDDDEEEEQYDETADG